MYLIQGYNLNAEVYRRSDDLWSITMIELDFKLYWIVHESNSTFASLDSVLRSKPRETEEYCLARPDEQGSLILVDRLIQFTIE